MAQLRRCQTYCDWSLVWKYRDDGQWKLASYRCLTPKYWVSQDMRTSSHPCRPYFRRCSAIGPCGGWDRLWRFPKFSKMATDEKPIYGPFFGVMGAASAMVFSGELKLFLQKYENLPDVSPLFPANDFPQKRRVLEVCVLLRHFLNQCCGQCNDFFPSIT